MNELRMQMLDELKLCLHGIDLAQIDELAEHLRHTKRIFAQGKGRMGLILRYFLCRLGEMGFSVHWVGEVTTPPIESGDLLLVTPTGGDPKSSTRFLEVARECGALVAAFTANRLGPVGRMADCFVEANARTMEVHTAESVQPMCSTLEQTGHLVFGCLAEMLRTNIDAKAARKCVWETLVELALAAPTQELETLSGETDGEGRIFFGGAGAQRLILSCWAMRVHHMGGLVWLLDDPGCPAPEAGDRVILCTESGRDPEVLWRLAQAKKVGARGVCLTAHPQEAARQKSGHVIYAPCAEAMQRYPGAWEEALLPVLDLLVLYTMRRHGKCEAMLSARHTNLE